MLAFYHAVPLSRCRSFATAAPSSVSSSSPPRCHRLRSIRSVRCFLIASASSSHHHACGSYPPRLSPRLSCRGTGGGYGLTAGCSDVIALLLVYPMPFPRLGRFSSHPSHTRRLVRFASMHMPTEVRSAAVRMPCGRLCLLPRLSVSIVFKMFSCQSFKILRLFGIARLGEYRGRSCPIASPSHLRFASAVSG